MKGPTFYSAERWHFADDFPGNKARVYTQHEELFWSTPGVARRATACVNDCAGISTEALERGAVREVVRMLELSTRVLTAMCTDGPRPAREFSQQVLEGALAALAKVRPE